LKSDSSLFHLSFVACLIILFVDCCIASTRQEFTSNDGCSIFLYVVVNTVSKTAGNLTVVVSRAAAGTRVSVGYPGSKLPR